jgi:hypothetical protein
MFSRPFIFKWQNTGMCLKKGTKVVFEKLVVKNRKEKNEGGTQGNRYIRITGSVG